MSFNKILLIKFRNIGDVLLSTPLAQNLKYHYPDAKIDFAINKECADMLSFNPNIDNIIKYDRTVIKNLSIWQQLKSELKLIKQIRDNNYDLVINLTEGEKGATLSYFSGAKTKLGFAVRKGLLSKIKVFDKLGDDKKRQHTVEKDLQFIELLGKKIYKKEVSIYWQDNIEIKINKILKKHNIKKFVHIHPVSRWMFKCWEDDRMARVIDYIEQVKKTKVIITGAPFKKETDRITKILSLCDSKPLNLTGKITLKQLACLSAKAQLFFGIDSAPMHMAAAVNTPVVALFGASYPEVWGPWNNQKDRGYFVDENGVQFNGMHRLICNMNHQIFYEDNIKKSKGMEFLAYNEAKKMVAKVLIDSIK